MRGEKNEGSERRDMATMAVSTCHIYEEGRKSVSVVSARYLTAPRQASLMFPPTLEGRERERGDVKERREEGRKAGKGGGVRKWLSAVICNGPSGAK